MATKHKEQSGHIPSTIENLAKVANNVEGYLDVAVAIAPAVVWSDSALGHIETFQVWVQRVADGDPVADIGRTLGTGIGLSRTLEKELDEFFLGKLEEFISLAASVRQECPGLFAPMAQEIEAALSSLTTAVQVSDFHDELVPAFRKCWDLLIPLRARVEEAEKNRERRAKEVAEAQKEQSARTQLKKFAVRKIA